MRSLLIDNVPLASIDASEIAPILDSLCPGIPAGISADVMAVPSMVPASACAALRTAVDATHSVERDTVDGAEDHQLNLTADELVAIVGSACVDGILAAARQLDVRQGGSGARLKRPERGQAK